MSAKLMFLEVKSVLLVCQGSRKSLISSRIVRLLHCFHRIGHNSEIYAIAQIANESFWRLQKSSPRKIACWHRPGIVTESPKCDGIVCGRTCSDSPPPMALALGGAAPSQLY
jgi:hypothetical protein